MLVVVVVGVGDGVGVGVSDGGFCVFALRYPAQEV